MKKFLTTFLGLLIFSTLLTGAIGVFSVHAASKTCGANNYTDSSGVTKGADAAICISTKCSAEEIEDLVPGCFSDGFVAPDREQVNEKINEESFRAQVLKIVNYFLTFLGLLAVVAIVYAGIIMVADFGNEEMVGKAKSILLWASIGMIIVLLSFSFVNFILDIGEEQPVQCFETSTSTSPVNCSVCNNGWITEKSAQGQTKRVCKEGATNSASISMCENGTIPCYTCENGWNILTQNCLAANASASSVQCFEGGSAKLCSQCQYGGWNDATRQCFDASVVSAQSPLKCNDGNGRSIPCFQCPNGWDINNNSCLALKPFGAPLCLESNGTQKACSACANGGFNTATRQCFDSQVLSSNPTTCKNNGEDLACYLCPSGGWNTVTNECIQSVSVPISDSGNPLSGTSSGNALGSSLGNTPGTFSPPGSSPLSSSNSINIVDNIGSVLDNIGKINNETSGLLNRIQNNSNNLRALTSRVPSNEDQKALDSIVNASGLSEIEKRDLQNAILQSQRNDLLDDFQSVVSRAARGELSRAETDALSSQLSRSSPAALGSLINDESLSSGERAELLEALNTILTPHDLLRQLRSGQVEGDDLEDIRSQLNRDAQQALDKVLSNQSLNDSEERDLIEGLNRISGLPSPSLLTKAFNKNLSAAEQKELEKQLQKQAQKIVERISEDKNLSDEEKKELEKAVTQVLLSDPKNIEDKLIENALSGKLPKTDVDRLLEKLSPEAGTLLSKSHSPRLVNAAERKAIEDVLSKYFSPEEVADALYSLDTGRQVPDEEEDVLKEALNAQGIDRQVAENIVQKIVNGEVLTKDEGDIVVSALKYGLIIQSLETELKILFDSMPKTAVNMAAYNDVITALTELKSDPTNEKKLLLLKSTFAELKKLIAATPKIIAKIQASPSQGTAPLIVTFDGSDSFDPNEQTIPHANYHWTFVDHTGTEKTIGTGPIVDHLFEESGLYIIQLQVETDKRENEYKTVMDGYAKIRIKVEPKVSDLQIYVNSKKVEFLRKVNIDDAKRGITFDASESIAKIGRQIVEYKWSFGDGSQDSVENGETLVHSYKEVGTYKIKLEVKDNTGAVSSRNFRIIIEHLTANIELSPEEGTTTTLFKLHATGSKSSDSLIQEYFWEVRDSEGLIVKTDDKENSTFKPSKPGKYTVKLSVSDAEGNQDSEVSSLVVRSLAPTANYTIKKQRLSAPAFRVFDASSSSDPEGEPLKYSWDFDGDGVFEIENISDASYEHEFSKTGSYKINLKVNDPHGEEDTLIRNVYIESILNVDFALSAIAVQKTQEITAIPESNYATNFFWNFGDDTHLSGGLEPVMHSYSQAGNYMITLTVFDDENNENMVNKRVFIGDGENPVAAYEIQVSGRKKFPETGICKEGLGATITRRDTVSLSGAPSINIDGSAHMLDYTWNFGDGEFGSTKVSAHRYAEVNEDDCYKVVLKVKDRITGKSNSTEPLYIKVINMPPVIQKLIIQDDPQDEKVTPYEVRLRAQGAYDPDGNIKKYRWWYRRVDEPESKKRGLIQTQTPYANLTIVSDGVSGLENEYIFAMEITDNEGASSLSEELIGTSNSVIVMNGNVNAPVVDFSMDKNQIYVGDTISFFAQVTDSQGKEMKNIRYEWDFNGDGIFDDTQTGMQVIRQFNTPGEFSVRLRVKDKGLASSKRHTVYVDQITRYPLAAFTYQVSGNELFADASTSRFDPALEDNILRYAWDFDKLTDSDGDGDLQNDVQSDLINPQYPYGSDGNYFVTLRVTDSLGNVDTVERKVTIGSGSSAIVSNSGNNALEKRSIILSSKTSPITTLDMNLGRSKIKAGESTTLSSRVINADGSAYNDEVVFEIIEGEAALEQDIVKANNGVAETSITALSEGIVIIKAIAKNTFYETLEENIRLEVDPALTKVIQSPEPTDDDISIREIREEEAENTLEQIE